MSSFSINQQSKIRIRRGKSNNKIRKNGFKTAREEQLFPYGDSIIKSVERTWQEIKPLYQKLHAVARFEIQNIFGEKLVKSDGAIPAHLLVSI